LVELLMVLAIAAVLLTVAMPGMAALIQSSRLAAATNDLLASLHFSRSEAIKRGARAVMCVSADGDSCAPTGGWHQGWLIFHDADNNAARGADERVMLVQPPLDPGVRVTGNLHVSRYISFAPSGGTLLVSGAFQAGTLTLCNEAGAGRRIVISSTGRARIVKLDACP
jgi:type IV fimbrial biogenesis protein FimT